MITAAQAMEWIQTVVTKNGEGCRDWPYRMSVWNRPYFNSGSERVNAAYVILEMTGRDRPSRNHSAKHSCGRFVCVAPWHLRWGPYEERNQLD